MTTVAVIGASGFIGRATSRELLAHGYAVKSVVAPRLRVELKDPAALISLAKQHPLVDILASQLAGAAVVVNAAGVSNSRSGDLLSLVGANALLPALVARASDRASVERLIHVSSAAVQGRQTLDESPQAAPTSPYSLSKANGERVLLLDRTLPTVILRPTSVHGQERAVTSQVARLARGPLSVVAGKGQRHTPQVHVSNVAAALRHLADLKSSPPDIVLQPSEGFSCSSFLSLMGGGRQPKHLPESATRFGIDAASRIVSGSESAAMCRRIEMLLLGQEQASSWLESTCYKPVFTKHDWASLAVSLARNETVRERNTDG